MSAWEHHVHLDRDGRPRCGQPGARFLGSGEEVSCRRCTSIMDGTYGVGRRQPEEPCGTAAAYRWHLRHDGKPVRCQSCLAAERRRNARRRLAA